MADNGAEFTLSLLDKTSGPATTAEKKLRLLEARMKALDKLESSVKTDKARDQIRFQRMGLEIQKDTLAATVAQQRASESWVTKLNHGLELAKKFGGTIWNAAKGVGKMVAGYAEMAVDAATAKEQQFLTFRTLTGSAETAKDMLNVYEALADKTPYGADTMTDWGRKLMAAGFNTGEAPSVLRMVSDLGASMGADEGTVGEAVMALRRVRQEGVLTSRTMRSLHNLGLDGEEVFRRLGKQFNMTAEQAKKLAGQGKIGTGSIFDAMIGATADARSGGKLGTAAANIADESGAVLIKKVKERWERFFEDLFEAKGYGRLKGFMRNVLAALDTTTGEGKRMAEAITGSFDRMFEAIFGRLDGPDGLQLLETMVRRIATGVEIAGVALTGAAQGFASGFMATIKPLMGDVEGLFDGPMSPEKLEQIRLKFEGIGDSIGKMVGWMVRAVNGVSEFTSAFGFAATGDKSGGQTYSNNAFGRGLAQVHYIGEKWKAKADDMSIPGTFSRGLAGPFEAAWDATSVVSAALFGGDPNATTPVIPPPTAPEGGFSAGGAPVTIAPQVQVSVDARGASREAADSIAETSSAKVDKAVAGACTRAAMSCGAM